VCSSASPGYDQIGSIISSLGGDLISASLGKKVLAHVGENSGFQIAYNAGVDTLAHMPCAALDPNLLHEAVHDGMKFISTIDTLAS
jgi:hypothetical protein